MWYCEPNKKYAFNPRNRPYPVRPQSGGECRRCAPQRESIKACRHAGMPIDGCPFRVELEYDIGQIIFRNGRQENLAFFSKKKTNEYMSKTEASAIEFTSSE